LDEENTYNSEPELGAGLGFQPPAPQGGSPLVVGPSAAWGGRPTGESRRAIRMQAEWDAQQEAMLKQQQMALAASREQRAYTDQMRRYALQDEEMEWKRKAQITAENIEHRTNQHVAGFLEGLRGGEDFMGNPIPPIDPESEDYEKRINGLIRDFPLAPKHPQIAPIVDSMNNMFQTRKAAEEDRVKESQETKSKQDQRLTELTKLASQTNRNLSDLAQMDSETGELIIDPVAVGEAQAELDIVTETRRAEAVVQAAENRDRIAREKELDKDIRRENQRLIELKSQRESAAQKQATEASRNKILDLRIEKAELQGLVFDSEEEAEKAAPPSGSIIYIGRKPHKVP
jgi:hypothetical protein